MVVVDLKVLVAPVFDGRLTPGSGLQTRDVLQLKKTAQLKVSSISGSPRPLSGSQ